MKYFNFIFDDYCAIFYSTFGLCHMGPDFFPHEGVFAYTSDKDNSAREWYLQIMQHNTMTSDHKNIKKHWTNSSLYSGIISR